MEVHHERRTYIPWGDSGLWGQSSSPGFIGGPRKASNGRWHLRDGMKMKCVKRASWVEMPARAKVREGADRPSKELAIHVEGAGGTLVGKEAPATQWRNLYVIREREEGQGF